MSSSSFETFEPSSCFFLRSSTLISSTRSLSSGGFGLGSGLGSGTATVFEPAPFDARVPEAAFELAPLAEPLLDLADDLGAGSFDAWVFFLGVAMGGFPVVREEGVVWRKACPL